ncbi:MAG: patatin-like phospholipase family protein [Gammaproteobacteria bacterium]|nr:patatin-like phospholipase family protein [Gammaproteobacteria bacterium]
MGMAADKPKIGLILTGGGARAAYQVGVLKAVAKLLPEGAANPFRIICGSSAGAINAAALAIYADRFQEGVRRLVWVWENFHVDQVFRADARSMSLRILRWFAAVASAGLWPYKPHSLLDNQPLRDLLDEVVPCKEIQSNIDKGVLDAVCITASGYTSGDSVSFFQARPDIQTWRRERRVGSATQITTDHLVASAAIPLIFPAVQVSREYFGDGSMRQSAPLSPALHLGAQRLLVIGVRREKLVHLPREQYVASYPGFGQIAGFILDTLFLDSLYTDLERLQRINKTISLIPNHRLEEEGSTLRRVETLRISPSQDISAIAARHYHDFPRPVRYLLRAIGALKAEGRGLISYLLFERAYCRELINQGYRDTMVVKDELMAFLNDDGYEGGDGV